MDTKLILFFVLLLLNNVYCKLKFVLEIFRHGARSSWSPIGGLNSTKQDVLGEFWENSSPFQDPELTPMGMRQQYLLGVQVRKKYIDSGFLSKTYNSKEILVYATNKNRVIN